MRSSQNQTPAGPASAWHRVGELAPTVLQKSDGIGLASDRILFRYRKSEPCCAKGENASIVSPDESGSHSERSRLHKFCHLFRSVAQKFHNRLDLFAVSSQSIVGRRRQSPDTQLIPGFFPESKISGFFVVKSARAESDPSPFLCRHGSACPGSEHASEGTYRGRYCGGGLSGSTMTIQ
jgi:hypothetical protein